MRSNIGEVHNHLIDGDNSGNKLIAKDNGDGTVSFITITIEVGRQGDRAVRERTFATVPIGRIIALAEVLQRN